MTVALHSQGEWSEPHLMFAHGVRLVYCGPW
jgi:hypothetical protein